MAYEEETKSGGMIKDTIEAATGLVKAVPIYDDAIQPAAKEIGKSLGTVAKLVNVALMPITAIIWGADKLNNFFEKKVAPKLENIPPENIITPDPHVVGPAIESLRFTGQNETLADMYANLIANAMDKDTVKKSHPGFVEIIKNLTSDEGLILKYFNSNHFEPILEVKKLTGTDETEYNMLSDNFSIIGEKAKLNHKDLTPNYINNLCRLGLLSIPNGIYLTNERAYDELTSTIDYLVLKESIEAEGLRIDYNKRLIKLTSLGIQFQQACIVDKDINYSLIV